MTETLRDSEERAQPDAPSASPRAHSPDLSAVAVPPAGPPAAGNPRVPVDSELLDRVIERIFTAGLLLGGAARHTTPEVAASIEQAIAELDDAVRDIRADVLTASAANRADASASGARRP